VQEQAKITSKGQVTLPRDVRRMLGVDAGDRILFEGNSEEIRTFAKYRGIGNPGIGPGRKGITRWLRELRGELD